MHAGYKPKTSKGKLLIYVENFDFVFHSESSFFRELLVKEQRKIGEIGFSN